MAVVIVYIDHFRDRVVEGKKLGVEPICRVLNQAGVQIAPRTYYAAKNRVPSARAVRDEELKEEIRLFAVRGERPVVIGVYATVLAALARSIRVL